MKAGDFTNLASDYSEHRPDYCFSVLKALCGLLEKTPEQIDFADIGAGTGIWTRMVCEVGVKSALAIEPNVKMRSRGEIDSRGTSIRWLHGSAEETGLPSSSIDWITMASSFHWTDFAHATAEFNRVLRRGGRFTALWNPRLIRVSPLLVEIENHLNNLRPDIKRISSGLSGITNNLTEELYASGYFEDVVYLEGRHRITMTRCRYLGAWRSVNDLRVQLGEKKFAEFLSYLEERTMGLETIEAIYLTRAWSARRKGGI